MAVAFTALGTWLQTQPGRHNLNRMTAAAQIGIGLAQVRTSVRLSILPTHRFIADDPPNPDEGTHA